MNSQKRIRRFPGLILFILSLGLTAIAAPSDLDPTFGAGGKVVWSPSGNTESRGGSGMALQADGKIVMAGGFVESTLTPAFMVVRFNSDGTIDTTFGTNGYTTITFGGTDESASSVAIQPDGKIVVGGRTTLPSVGSDVAVARLEPNGSLDTSFSGDGKVTVGFTVTQQPTPDYLKVIEVAPNGKIVFAGGSGPGPNLQYFANTGRLNSDGSPDSSFGSGGRVINGLGSGIYQDVLANSDGSIYLTGAASAQFSSMIRVDKYNDNGSIAWTYSRTIQPGCYMSLNAMAQQSDGKLVVAGSDNCTSTVIRLNTSGTFDTTFHSGAIPDTDQATAVAVQPDGKILASIGYSADGFSLVRYNTDGSFDTNFGIGGVARIRVLSGNESARNMVIQTDGKILLGGSASVGFNAGYRFAMVRYMGGLSAPRTPAFDFDGDGKSDFGVFRPSTGTWFLQRSGAGEFIQPFGTNGDRVAAADYDGDNKTDLAIYRNGDWWTLNSSNGGVGLKTWGTATDTPLPSDFDGDGKADFIYYRPSTGEWFRSGSTGATSTVQFGIAGDIPLVADMDGDGKTDPTIFRPSNGTFWYRSSVTSIDTPIQWGQNGDVPVPADYDGDGKTDAAVWRPSNGAWYMLQSGTGSVAITSWGLSGDKPVPADYDGDGRADVAIWRPSTGVWFILQSTAGFTGMQYGIGTDRAVPNAYLP